MSKLPLDQLAELLRAQARGVYASEAATELLIAHDVWLRRPDFVAACVSIDHDPTSRRPSPAGPGYYAWVDWDRVPAFLVDAACSTSEARVLRLATELAGVDTATPLAELLASLDDRNARLVVAAIRHAQGRVL